MWFLYIIECEDGKLYTGITQDVGRRFQEHQRQGSHFTSYNHATKLLHTEEYPTRQEAESRESQIKRWSKAKKLALINKDFEALRCLSKSRD